MKKMIIALSMVLTSQVFASNCFQRVDNDFGLNLSKVICVENIEFSSAAWAKVTFTLDGKRVVKNMPFEKTSSSKVLVAEGIEAIYTSERPECSRAFEGHTDLYIQLNNGSFSIQKIQGRLIEKGNYCYEESAQLVGVTRYSQI